MHVEGIPITLGFPRNPAIWRIKPGEIWRESIIHYILDILWSFIGSTERPDVHLGRSVTPHELLWHECPILHELDCSRQASCVLCGFVAHVRVTRYQQCETHWGLRVVCAGLYPPDFNQIWFLVDRFFFVGVPNIKFDGKPSGGSRADAYGRTDWWTDMTKLMVPFRGNANAPKKPPWRINVITPSVCYDGYWRKLCVETLVGGCEVYKVCRWLQWRCITY
jgi:hypothetical protein